MPLTVNIKRNRTEAQVSGPFGGLGKRSQNLHEKCPQNRLEEGRFQALHCLGGTHHVAGCELLQSEGLGSTEAVFRSGSIYAGTNFQCWRGVGLLRKPPIPLTMSSLLV